MKFVTLADLAATIRRNVHKIPHDVDFGENLFIRSFEKEHRSLGRVVFVLHSRRLRMKVRSVICRFGRIPVQRRIEQDFLAQHFLKLAADNHSRAEDHRHVAA